MKRIVSFMVAIALIALYLALDHIDKKGGLAGVFADAGTRAGDVRAESATVGEFAKLSGCSLVPHPHNDGDSFYIRHGGNEYQIRLYFVDAPESAFKTYRNGDDNGQRLNYQARDLGGLSREQVIEIGQEAKKFTTSLLEGRPFTLYTKWEDPYNDGRKSGFIEVETAAGQKRLLNELLVEQGLARIYTKGTKLPDGTPEATHERQLRSIEAGAQRGKVGAWRH